MSKLLPPGDVPAWDGDDLANTIADTWEFEMWPAVWPKLVLPYASTAARDADLAGLSSGDEPVWAYTRDTNTLWVWTGAAWVQVWTSGTSWSTYTVAWSQSDGAGLAIGNGSIEGRWKREGGIVVAQVVLTRGSTSNTGTLSYRWSLPTPAADIYQTGSGLVVRGTEHSCTARLVSSTLVALIRNGDDARISNSVPGSWAAGDTIQFTITYRPAA